MTRSQKWVTNLPLYVLVSKLNKRVAINTTIEWPENDLNPSWSSLAASATSAATNFTVAGAEGNYFNKYDLVKIPSTGEIILVTATAACAVTAIRALKETIGLVKPYLVLETLINSITPAGGKLYGRVNQQDRFNVVSVLHRR